MIKHRFTVTHSEAQMIVEIINSGEEQIYNSWQINRLNVYKAYALLAIRKRLHNRLFNYKREVRMSLTMVDIITIVDAVKPYISVTPILSDLFMQMECKLPPQIK